MNLGRVSRSSFWRSYWPERLAALIAVAGVAISILVHFHPREWESYACDYKTMYGSFFSLLHGANAYDFKNIAAVFDANGVIQPVLWYAHSPVYPPFTLGLMAPLAWLPMVPSIFVWFGLCALALVGALASLARSAGEEFGLSRLWRLALIGLGAAWPLVSFAFLVENVSLVVCSLSILAFTAREGDRRWLRALGLAIALLLKPHIALWAWIALVLLPEKRGRWIAWRSAAMACGITAMLCLGMAVRGDLGMQVRSFRKVLRSETTAGSMSSASRLPLMVEAEILSVDSLASYYPELTGTTKKMVVWTPLLLAAVALLWASTRRGLGRLERFPMFGAWCALGLVATYHRSHDSLVMLALLPWLLARVRRSLRDPVPWAILVLLFALSMTLQDDTWATLGGHPAWHSFVQLMLYRQAACVALLLAAMLVGVALHAAWKERRAAEDFGSERLGLPSL